MVTRDRGGAAVNTNVTSSSTQNITCTMTWRQRLAHPTYGGWWGVLDRLGHQLHLPNVIQRIICDRYEIAVGIPREDLIEMDYKGRAPWWLR